LTPDLVVLSPLSRAADTGMAFLKRHPELEEVTEVNEKELEEVTEVNEIELEEVTEVNEGGERAKMMKTN
jgi:hypothetical protein